jgi:hypothetical protein
MGVPEKGAPPPCKCRTAPPFMVNVAYAFREPPSRQSPNNSTGEKDIRKETLPLFRLPIAFLIRAACAADARAAYVAEQREVHGRDVSEEDFVSCRLMKQPKRGDLAANCLTESQS